MPKSRSRRRPVQRRTSGSRASAAPSVLAAPAPGLRGGVERRSSAVLVWLSQRPKALLPLLAVALLVGGLAAPRPVALPLLAVLVALVGWLTYLSWPVVHGRARLVRGLTLGLLVVALAAKAAGD